MQLKIIYLSETRGELYNHHIVFPKVENSRLINYHWNKFLADIGGEKHTQTFIGDLKNAKWWMSGNYISNRESTFQHVQQSIYKKVSFKEIPKEKVAHIDIFSNTKVRVLETYDIP